MPITDLLERNAAMKGTQVAIVELSPRSGSDRIVSWRDYETSESYPDQALRREMTWKFMDEQANRVANFCLSRGLGKGSRVALLMKNALEWFPLYFGVMRSGALVVPLNFRNTKDETKKCLELTRADAIFFGPGYAAQIESIHGELPWIRTFVSVAPERPDFAESYFEGVGKLSSDDPGVELSDDEDAAIYFTSGTTGQPKAILHTHSSILSVCVTEQTHHGQDEDDVFLCLAPLFHTGAMMHWLGSLVSCSRAVLLRDGKPLSILKAISLEGVTIAFMLVPWVQDILQDVENGILDFGDFELSQWRLMHIGAQPVPAELIARWRAYFPDQRYDTNYGLSESMGPGCVHLGIENTHKVGAIGKPGVNWQAAIVSEDGHPVERGAIGELTVKGPGVMERYLDDEESSSSALRDGWLFTGDMGYEDEDGFIYLVDRKKDVIISGGENIFPIQIEDHIRALSKVKDVAVIGGYDRRLVEVPIAVVSVKEGLNATEEELAAHCETLPKYKCPRRFILADVPRNPTGKIEKPRLRAMYAGNPVFQNEI
ncbi:MAG: AMP-binding protein [Synergistaceae bacterium]|jgi:acyl-CoA synthetase (AMP-forming)/AMP-acid ligase II|nr:AMP-binding protein [Synergistaceae bacterium]